MSAVRVDEAGRPIRCAVCGEYIATDEWIAGDRHGGGCPSLYEIPGTVTVTLHRGEVVRWAFTPCAGDAGYFGISADGPLCGPEIPLGDDDFEPDAVGVWPAIRRNLGGHAPFVVEWTE